MIQPHVFFQSGHQRYGSSIGLSDLLGVCPFRLFSHSLSLALDRSHSFSQLLWTFKYCKKHKAYHITSNNTKLIHALSLSWPLRLESHLLSTSSHSPPEGCAHPVSKLSLQDDRRCPTISEASEPKRVELFTSISEDGQFPHNISYITFCNYHPVAVARTSLLHTHQTTHANSAWMYLMMQVFSNKTKVGQIAVSQLSQCKQRNFVSLWCPFFHCPSLASLPSTKPRRASDPSPVQSSLLGENVGCSSSPNALEHHVQACNLSISFFIIFDLGAMRRWHGLYLRCHSSPYPPTGHLVKPIVTLTLSLRLVMALKPAKASSDQQSCSIPILWHRQHGQG